MPEDLDQNTINNIKELMADKFPEVVEGYMEDSDERIAKIKEGFESNDCQQVSDYAHPLKSSSATLGLFPLSSVAEKIEFLANDACKNSQDMTKIRPLLDDLQSAYADAKKKLLVEVNA